MQAARAAQAAEAQRLPCLLDCAIIALMDGCPPDPRRQLCRYTEDYQEDACERCWFWALTDAANGEDGEWQRGRWSRDADSIAGR